MEKSTNNNLKEYYPGIRKKSTKSEMEERKKILMQIAKDYMALQELTDEEKEKIRQENLRLMKIGQQTQKRIAAAKEKAKKRKEKKILHHSKIDYSTEKGIEMIYRDHLKNFLPKMYKEMTDQDFQEQAERVHQDVQKQKHEIMKDGTPEMLALMQAWELNRERILIDPDQDEDENQED